MSILEIFPPLNTVMYKSLPLSKNSTGPPLKPVTTSVIVGVGEVMSILDIL